MASMDEDWNEENDVKDDWGDDAAAADDGEGWDDDNDNGWGDEHDPLSESTELTIAPSNVPLMKRATSYVVMETTALEKKEAALIAQTAEVLDVTQNEAGCLLRHYGWKSRKLQTEWFADQKKVRETVGITSEEDKVVSTESVRQCESAYCDEVAVELGHALNCGHFFCGDCWEAYLTSQIQHGAASIFTKCMGMKCKEDHPHKFGCSCREMVPTGLFFRFVKDQTLLEKYKRWLLDSFVEGQKNIKWCPKPGCVNAVFYNSGGTTAVQCRCGHYFCFSCNEDAHSPAPCDLVAKWLLREKSDDATAIWLAARTKECPKCSVRIEKNKACNHMKCVKCGHDFCWLCKGPWSSHGSQSGGYYVCNKYDADIKEGKVSSEEKDILDNQKLLQKYTYYYKRFKSSADAIALTQKLGIKLEKAMKDEDISKHSFIQEAIEKLIAARRVLQWTYMLSYYLKSGGKKHLFEYQQEMLISNTEALQDIMESNDGPKLLALRKDVINRTSSIDKFRAEMVQQVERGDFEDLLLSKADLDIDNWACSNCKYENKKDAAFCNGCQACRKHGEPDCKACKPPS